MRKALISVIAVALLLAVGVCAMAESWTMYVKENNVKVYKKADKSSKVLTKMNGNDKVTCVDEIGGWTKISYKVKGKKKTGWISNKYLSESPVPSKCKHNWGKWETRKEPTCTEKGSRVRYCKKCGLMEEGDIKKAEHEYGKWKVTEEATCTETGEKVRKCKNCGHKQTKEIPKTEHNYGKWTVTDEATCTEEGVRTRKCKDCGHKETEKYLEPHEFGEWEITREPTCSKSGKKLRKCVNCGYEETKHIDRLPHDFKWDITLEATDHSSGTRARVCQVCGYAEDEESYDPEGTLRRGDRGEEVQALQQLLVDQGYLNAGGADGAYGGGTEKALMQFQKDQGLNPDGVAWPQTQKRLSHDFGAWETVKALTRAEAGERRRVCKDCGYIQRETLALSPYFEIKDRGESIRAIQQMLTALGYNTGSYDGIYGKKLDAAFIGFAKDNGIEFQTGSIRPIEVDALVNSWIAAIRPEDWKGEGSVDSPVNLALTVTPASDSDENADMRTYNWTLTNLGAEKCMFNALLLSYGEQTDFSENNLTVVVDGVELKANCANSASGSFSVSADWGEGNLNFAAMAVDEKDGSKWLSNAVVFDSALSEVIEPSEAA